MILFLLWAVDAVSSLYYKFCDLEHGRFAMTMAEHRRP